MKKLTIAATIAGLCLVLLSTAAARQNRVLHSRVRTRFLALHIAHDLNLTDEQRAGIKAILEKEKPAIQSLAGEFLKENAELRSKPNFDEAFVRSVAQERSATMTEALVEKEKIRAQIFALLTPVQQQKVDQLADELRSVIQDRIGTLGDQL
jgi:periplasmic protein CpxP/Spy